MSLFRVFDISGSALAAQSVRLNTIASNMANADVVAGSPDAIYRARHPVFSTIFNDTLQGPRAAGVEVESIMESEAKARREFAPAHPMADAEGFIYRSNVSAVDELANMISASRSYQSSIKAMETSKQLIMSTLNLGK